MAEGNILFLVCSPCEKANEPDFGVKLCERSRAGWYEGTTPAKQFDLWLTKHRKCGDGPDHFMLAHRNERNHDQVERKKTRVAVQQALDS